MALSWLMMAVESPISVGIISRLPDAKVNTAAFLVLMGMSLWIESPVIDLLATSTTLVSGPRQFQVLRRFALALMALATLTHAAVALTPALYDLVTIHLLGLRPDIAEAGRTAFIIMIPWSACIGWRRFLQGVLIRNHLTRLIGIGTAIRVTTMATMGVVLYAFAPLPGVQIAAIGLVCSVFAESLFISLASRSTVGRLPQEGSNQTVDWMKLVRFHAPLTLTTLLLLTGNPVVSAALARAPDAVGSMASWQVALTLIWLLRTVVFALPEVVITLYRDRQSAAVLRRFCWIVGLACSGTMLLVTLTGLDRLFFVRVLDADPAVARGASLAVLGCSLLPLIGALQSYLRGMLTAHHMTFSRLWAIGIGLATLLASLGLGLWLGISGILNASLAMTTSLLAELWVLLAAWRGRPTERS